MTRTRMSPRWKHTGVTGAARPARARCGQPLRCLFIHPEDISQVMGMAEAHYVHRHLRCRFEVQRLPFIPRTLPYRNLPTFLAMNLWSLRRAWEVWSGPTLDLSYAYKSAIFLPLLLRMAKGTPWVYDLQTHPVRQTPDLEARKGLAETMARFYYGLKIKANRVALRRCDLIVTVSEALKAQFVSQFQVPADKIIVLPLGVDCSLFKRESPPPLSPPAPLTMVYVSSVALYRGHDLCIEAARLLKEEGIAFRMNFIGSGPSRDVARLMRLTQDKGVVDHVSWRGYIPHQELPGALRDVHVGLSPLPDIEAYRVSSPTKVFEYMAIGMPVVASDILAHREIIQDGTTGLLFRPGDAESMARRIRQIHDAPQWAAKLGKNAQEASRDHDWGVILKPLDERIDAILGMRTVAKVPYL